MNIVILAAGPGKRMHSRTPKVLHRLAGRALLSHVFAAAKQLAPKIICVVYGHGGESVRQSVGDNGAFWVMQEPQLGTGQRSSRCGTVCMTAWPVPSCGSCITQNAPLSPTDWRTDSPP